MGDDIDDPQASEKGVIRIHILEDLDLYKPFSGQDIDASHYCDCGSPDIDTL